MSVTEALHQRPQVPVDPERAYQEWARELPARLPRTDWDQVDPHPTKEWLWAAELADTPGGSVLADYAEGLTEEDLDESLVLELIAGCERIKSWATARQAELITEMHTRSTGAPRPEHLDDAMRVRLGITGRSAGMLEDRARRLAHAPEVLKALKAGWIDVRKADVLLSRTDTLSTLEARAVQRKFIPTADRRTPPQLRADVDRAVLAIDPEVAEERNEAAKKTRTVTLNPASDGMAWLSAYLPAPEAMAAFTVMDVLAGESSPEDDRDAGARRADAFTRVFTEILDGGQTPGGCTLGTRQGVRPHLVITVAASTLAGENDDPAHLAGYGAITAAEAKRFAGHARATTIITDPDDGSYLAQHEGPPGDDAGAAIAAELARRSMLRRRLPWLYPEDLWDKERARQSAYDVRYIIERATKDGDSDPVAFLRAAGLLAADAYAPTAELRKHLALRDRTCRFPGCSTPGWKCQRSSIGGAAGIGSLWRGCARN
ncbi:MAG TPA: DUF222 domain-containing protein [Beutenbergiaceae bacterium]|nr:DUF222 domain-containing protein [Beutenbergiaceae bacterium]